MLLLMDKVMCTVWTRMCIRLGVVTVSNVGRVGVTVGAGVRCVCVMVMCKRELFVVFAEFVN